MASYKAFRLFPVDGLKIALEDKHYLHTYYSVSGGKNGYAAARASVLCDVLNKGLSLDAQIDKFSVGENKLAMRRIYRLSELNVKYVLQIENFSGILQQVIEQNFFAAMFLKNMVTFGKLGADSIVAENGNPDNKYHKTTNENQLIGLLKDKLVIALL